MNVNLFYAHFSTVCLALVGLWWNAIHSRADWMRDPARRHLVGGIYLSFLLPALMGLFAQIGGIAQPDIWRTAFIVLSVIGCVCALRLLAQVGGDHFVTLQQTGAALLYALIAVVGVFPRLARHVGLRPIQTEAILLVVLVILAHALAWRYMADESQADEET